MGYRARVRVTRGGAIQGNTHPQAWEDLAHRIEQRFHHVSHKLDLDAQSLELVHVHVLHEPREVGDGGVSATRANCWCGSRPTHLHELGDGEVERELPPGLFCKLPQHAVTPQASDGPGQRLGAEVCGVEDGARQCVPIVGRLPAVGGSVTTWPVTSASTGAAEVWATNVSNGSSVSARRSSSLTWPKCFPISVARMAWRMVRRALARSALLKPANRSSSFFCCAGARVRIPGG